MRYFDFSSWQGILATVLGLAMFTLIGVGIRIVMMMTIQQRQQRMNRQINERLRTLISAYKTLGGSFTGRLIVNPMHLHDLHAAALPEPVDLETAGEPTEPGRESGSDRARRIRDAVEAALSDIVLLGTQEQVRLAAQAASDLAAGKPIHTAELVVLLRDFIRKALDLDPIPADVTIPSQGPTRPQSSGGSRGKGEGGGAGGGGGGGGGAGGGGGMGMGMGGGMRRDEEGN
ncbi:hypothetical protein [Devosia ginsengisoli]|uniref:hypothetical protein n=1 Tax=Devosia ginsengisoli TaxID=400770 RepID=UPI0026F168FF|nr:hypothetical protein [Devosia ginsengisoli]MCR6670611.1 hypothetical protein [Devosia ginsengisoli]